MPVLPAVRQHGETAATASQKTAARQHAAQHLLDQLTETTRNPPYGLVASGRER
ncbi:hypothetical protein [Streptomyces griseolus]|uniref:hypothetical protein n=1 Tax=Streptomyces griseolus TaxID=1909 RepID=UPI00224490A8|nr:hypothetical protein [Streptomyces griseolus]MCW8216524.1 hypothetical protein [Streptomyces griseolus]